MASLSDLKQDRKDAEKKLRQYEKRLKEIKSIRGNLDKTCEDHVSDINGKIRSALSDFNNGLNKGTTNVENAVSPILQFGVYEDSDLTSCRSDLGREITRIEGKIEELKREIRRLKSDIEDAKDD